MTMRLRTGAEKSTGVHQPRLLRRAVLALALLGATTGSMAAGFPERPIRLVVAFPPGGGVDVAARLIGERVSRKLNQPVVVENLPGAAGNIGTDRVVKSKADGYTLLFASIANGINPSLYARLPFNPERDLAPVSLLSTSPYVLMANPASGISSISDLKKHSESTPGGVQFASAGSGSGSHLFMELLRATLKVPMTHVPYKGAAPAMNDVLGGQVPVVFDSIITGLPLIKAGKVKALGLSTQTRSAVAPEISTLHELGVTGYNATSWFGVFAPAGTPSEVVSTLSVAFAEAVKDPATAAKMRELGSDPVGSDPETLARFFANEVSTWRKLVRDIGVTLD
ncbi:tripartite tricarboxylate transporter substrate binding protein [Ramlibacter sp. AW1]|uniref:Tripartite tricarboxylate transporter substrate binding protein n=1 Tax=Ramlibacter aurantiacus TaxID=2801330 RepID=A0A937D3G2_9BURK|nr:tripartite tricarboxylate transporter substrate binding protein [Ramlibacter aurantiacus]MBL0422629.1 tripartite tricarboxylate transporter substrate binding protein [Ramlibacter aurantiacus]